MGRAGNPNYMTNYYTVFIFHVAFCNLVKLPQGLVSNEVQMLSQSLLLETEQTAHRA